MRSSVCYAFGLILLSGFQVQYTTAIRKYTRPKLLKLREEVRDMFNHAYSSYLKYAYPYDELRPLTCDGVDTWGSYSLTLIDALDSLAVMGNYTEFRRVVEVVLKRANFDADINVSVFETNIRIVGGLISAHLMSKRAGLELEPGWPCNGPLLRLAEDVAKRLLPAFKTQTGMPYGTVNLRHGVPLGETSVTCTAGIGTYILEFATISRLTGDPVYEEVALNALKVMYEHRSSIGLFGNHIDVMTGKWVARDSGIGAGVDSFFEYLVKGSILLGKPELISMFNDIRRPIDKYLKKNNWYVWASMNKGQMTLPVFQSLEAYWPGVLTLIGDIETALRSMHNYNSVWKQYGFTPEFYNIAQGQAGTNRESYPLRPELAESAMYLYRATGDTFMLDIGLNILRSIQHSAKTPCGYATIKDARDHSQENRMESFFLAETTKYLYLLFDPDNFIHNTGSHGTIHTLPSGKQCILDTGSFVFNTEAHPIDIGALHCCHEDDENNEFIPFNDSVFKGHRVEKEEKEIPPPLPDPEDMGGVTEVVMFGEGVGKGVDKKNLPEDEARYVPSESGLSETDLPESAPPKSDLPESVPPESELPESAPPESDLPEPTIPSTPTTPKPSFLDLPLFQEEDFILMDLPVPEPQELKELQEFASKDPYIIQPPLETGICKGTKDNPSLPKNKACETSDLPVDTKTEKPITTSPESAESEKRPAREGEEAEQLASFFEEPEEKPLQATDSVATGLPSPDSDELKFLEERTSLPKEHVKAENPSPQIANVIRHETQKQKAKQKRRKTSNLFYPTIERRVEFGPQNQVVRKKKPAGKRKKAKKPKSFPGERYFYGSDFVRMGSSLHVPDPEDLKTLHQRANAGDQSPHLVKVIRPEAQGDLSTRKQKRRKTLLTPDIEKPIEKSEKKDGAEKHEPIFHGGGESPPIENTSKGPVVTESTPAVSFSLDDSSDRMLGDKEIKSEPMSLTDYVKQLLLSAPTRPQFDPQDLLDTVRNQIPINVNWTSRYDYLTCQAQPFHIRITLSGEFSPEK